VCACRSDIGILHYRQLPTTQLPTANQLPTTQFPISLRIGGWTFVGRCEVGRREVVKLSALFKDVSDCRQLPTSQLPTANELQTPNVQSLLKFWSWKFVGRCEVGRCEVVSAVRRRLGLQTTPNFAFRWLFGVGSSLAVVRLDVVKLSARSNTSWIMDNSQPRSLQRPMNAQTLNFQSRWMFGVGSSLAVVKLEVVKLSAQ